MLEARRRVTGFAELPARIAALTREHERVAVVLLDAFGWAFVQRHADHPFLRRLEIEPVASQFPSTTTAHLTTLYTGLPVERARALRVADLRAGGRRRDPPAAVRRPRDGTAARRIDPRRARPGPDVLRAARRPGARPAARRRSRHVDLQLGGARGRATSCRTRRFEDGVARLGDTPGLTLPLLGPDRRRRPPLRPVERRVRRRRRCAALDALDRVRDTLAARHRRPRPDRRRRDRLPRRRCGRRCSSTCATRPAGLGARLLPARRPTRRPSSASCAARWASAPRSGSRPSCSRTPARACRPAWPTSACSPRPAGWRGCSAYPSPQLRFKGHHGGLTPEESETWVGIMQA